MNNLGDLFIIDSTISEDGKTGVVVGVSESTKEGLVVRLIVAENIQDDFQVVSDTTIDHLSHGSVIIENTLYLLSKNMRCHTDNLGVIDAYDLSQLRGYDLSVSPEPMNKLYLVDEIGYLFSFNGYIYHIGRNGIHPNDWCLYRISVPELSIDKYYDSSFPPGEIKGIVLIENNLSILYEGGKIFMFNLLEEKEIVSKKIEKKHQYSSIDVKNI